MRLLLILFCLLISGSAFAAPSLDRTYGHIPLAFTVNEGQAPSSIHFTAHGSGCGMAFSPTGTTFLLSRETAASAAKRAAKKSVVFSDVPTRDQPEYESFALKLAFLGANENPEIQGEDRLPWNNNYFIGNDPDKWRTDVPNYKNIRFKEVYNGIDLVYYGNQKRVKYDFVVKPGEDPNKILLKYDFGEAGGSLAVNEKGELLVKTPVGEMIEEKPYCYQKINGKEVGVEVRYEIVEGGTYRFRMGEYDRGAELVIDPELVYSTYLGGVGTDSVGGMAVDKEGCVYITGECAPHFPVTSAAYDTTYHGVFVSKLNPTGTALEYSTYLGGTGNDTVFSIAIDKEWNAYIAGRSKSNDFPTTSNAFDQVSEAGKGFVVKLDPLGKDLVYATQLGKNPTYIDAIVINDEGEALVTGLSTASFPTTIGVYNNIVNSRGGVFVTKINSAGSNLIFSTGIGKGEGQGIAITSSGEVIVGGTTDNYSYPTTVGAFDQTYNGGIDNKYLQDIIISKLSADGSKLIFSTYLGGSGHDYFGGIALDTADNVYVAGTTDSYDFPTTQGSFHHNYTPEDENGFVTKLSSDGSSLIYSTYINGKTDAGNGITLINDIAVDSKGKAYIVGSTNMKDYPTTSDALMTDKGAVLTIFNKDGSGLFYSSCWGGSGGEEGAALCIEENGDVYMAGQTGSRDFPITPGAICDSLTYEDVGLGHYIWSRNLFISKFHFSDITEAVEFNNNLPSEFRINSIYPNPFNPSTTIEFSLPRSDKVKLSIYSILGQKVYENLTNKLSVGVHRQKWDGRDQNNRRVSSGTYLVRLESENRFINRKVQLMK